MIIRGGYQNDFLNQRLTCGESEDKMSKPENHWEENLLPTGEDQAWILILEHKVPVPRSRGPVAVPVDPVPLHLHPSGRVVVLIFEVHI